MTNRQARRKMERDRAKQARVVTAPVQHHIEGGGMQPEPGPIGTTLARYKYGGKTWLLLTFQQPNSTTSVVFAPSDARQFAEDVLKVVGTVELTGLGVGEDGELADAAPTDSGLVIAKEMPK